jgi:hypothetical protein
VKTWVATGAQMALVKTMLPRISFSSTLSGKSIGTMYTIGKTFLAKWSKNIKLPRWAISPKYSISAFL